jgi:antitoxin VapB
MNKIQLIQQGNQQMILLPEGYKFTSKEVYLKKVGDSLIIISENPWQNLWESLEQFSDDFMETREQIPLEEREEF